MFSTVPCSAMRDIGFATAMCVPVLPGGARGGGDDSGFGMFNNRHLAQPTSPYSQPEFQRVFSLTPAVFGSRETIQAPPGLNFESLAAPLQPITPPPGLEAGPTLLTSSSSSFSARRGVGGAGKGDTCECPPLGKAEAASGTCSTADTETDTEEEPHPASMMVQATEALELEAQLGKPAMVIRLEDATVGLGLGCLDLPSAGSAAHWTGQCKPCAFFHKEQCQCGAACGFCHLCPPGEKRRRKQERKEVRQIVKSFTRVRL